MQKFYVGIDIGTYHVKAIIVGATSQNDSPMQVMGMGVTASKGMRHGYIVDKTEVTRSIKEAVARASQGAKVNVKKARIAIGGIGLDEINSSAEVTLTASGGIVSERDVERAKDESIKRASNKLNNRTVIHAIPLEYRLDGAKVFGKVEGLQGTKLGINTLLVTMLTQHHDDIISAVEAAGIEVDDIMASPLAASMVTLTKAQKTAGVVLANIGAETLSIIIFDNDIPISVKVFPTGSSDITNSIALSFQIPLTEAESLKRGGVIGSDIQPKKMQLLIASRLKDMFALVNAHLKSIGRERLLPAGIIITGGGSGIINATDIARTILKLPSQVGSVGLPRNSAVDGTWAVAYGLCRWAYADDSTERKSSLVEVFSQVQESLKNAFKTILP